jgi:pyruvate dehydrogenase E2 component (dihydrolipoamide acetyltransferase)
MPIQILMPALSPTMTEGNLARWLKKEGDAVKAGQVIAEIETDKATMEVEAVDEGTIGKIIIPAGSQGIKVNTPIAVLLEEGEDAAKLSAAETPPSLTLPTGGREPVSPAPSSAAPKATAQPNSLLETKGSDGGALQAGKSRIVASPLARRIAEQNKIDLSRLQGSGPNGRIIKIDVEQALKAGPKPAQAARSAQPAAQGIDARDYADKLGMAYTAMPNSSIRKVIARRLTESKQLVPHFYLSVDCELDELLVLRKKLNEAHHSKISVNDFIIRAVALALKAVPAANASWTDDAILQYTKADVSVAVATSNGLITPIIKQAETKSLLQISTEMKDLATRARDGKLRPEEFQGGGFSISNLGMFGVREFAAIINPPQSCILAVGVGEQRPVVKNGQLAIATVMSVTLSVDHRAVDGAVGAEFLQAFKPLIEQPFRLIG